MHPFVAMLALALGLVAVGIVVQICFLLLWLGTAAGVVVAFWIACAVLAGRGFVRPIVVAPRDVVAGTAGLPRLRRNRARERDWAWPGYPAAQWRHDWYAAWRTGRICVVEGYRRILRWKERFEHPATRAICTAVPLAGWTGVAAGMFGGSIAVAAAGTSALAVLWAGWGALIGALRAYDHGIRRIRKADAVCPHCYYKQHFPDYRCGCGTVHRDIRPGLLGAMWRRCGCGRRLPTTVLRAAHLLTAQCERCAQPLRAGSAAVTEITVPVFGPVSAGKTRLVRTGLVRLRDELSAGGAELSFDDESSSQAFEDGVRLLSDGANTAKTPAGRLPAAITARLRSGRREALLNLFDAAGEFYADRADNAALEFLDHAGGLVFVLDPFSIPWVQDRLGAQHPRLAAAQPAARPPEEVYQVTVRRLQDYRVDLGRRALAVVVVKADLLHGLSWAEPLLSGSAREWLSGAGQDNLLLSAERDFAATSFLAVSSVRGVRPGDALSPAAPLRWLLDQGGFPFARNDPALPAKETA